MYSEWDVHLTEIDVYAPVLTWFTCCGILALALCS